jgi:hypothetical protein
MTTRSYYEDLISRPRGAGGGALFPQAMAFRETWPARLTASSTVFSTESSFYHPETETSIQQKAASAQDVLVRIPSIEASKWKVELLQRWTGHVERLTPTTFVAVICDTTNRRNADEEVEIELNELSDSDIPLVAPGAPFYWSIGYRVDPGGQRQRVSELRFARHPTLGSADLKAAEERAKRRATALLSSD